MKVCRLLDSMVCHIVPSPQSEQPVRPQDPGPGLDFQTLLLSFHVDHELFRHQDEENANDKKKIEPRRKNRKRKKNVADDVFDSHFALCLWSTSDLGLSNKFQDTTGEMHSQGSDRSLVYLLD